MMKTSISTAVYLERIEELHDALRKIADLSCPYFSGRGGQTRCDTARADACPGCIARAALGMGSTARRVKTRRPALTERQKYAARCAIYSFLAGADGEGDWPEDVTRRDLEGAKKKLE